MSGVLKKITVVGGGFSGLVVAHKLLRAGFGVEVLEKSKQLGGLIQSIKKPTHLVETAANGVLNNASIEALFSEVGFKPVGTLKFARKRFVYWRGKPRQWPLSWGGTLRLIWGALKMWLFKEACRPQKGETINDWGSRILGAEATQRLLGVALQGIYASDADKLSASVILNSWFFSKGPRKHKRTSTGLRGIVSGEHGMSQLIDKIRDSVVAQGGVIKTDCNFSGITESRNHPIVLATSACAAAEITKDHLPVLASQLQNIKMLPLATVTLFFDSEVSVVQGFGCLIPPEAKSAVLGVLVNHCIFPNRVWAAGAGKTSETWMVGGSRWEDHLEDEEVLKSYILSERSRLFGHKALPADVTVTLWSEALPHYSLNLEAILDSLKYDGSNVFLIGNYLGGIGLSKIVERAENLVEEITLTGKWN